MMQNLLQFPDAILTITVVLAIAIAVLGVAEWLQARRKGNNG